MKGERLLLVGPRCDERVTGLRLCFDLLIDTLVTAGVAFDVVDTAGIGKGQKAGSVRGGRVLETLRLLPAVWRRLFRCRSVYLTLATSRLGSVRDALVIWPAALARCRIVGHLHGGGYSAYYDAQSAPWRWFLRMTLRRTDTLIVLADALRDQFAFDSSLESRLVVVGNGLPFPRPDIWPDAKRLSPGEPRRILYLSNLIPSKGYLDLLEACAILVNEAGVSIEMDFCGEFLDTSLDDSTSDDPIAAFTQRITDTGLDDCVHWHGVVTGDRKTELLRNAHVLVLPTAYPWEGQPICLIEALASATPLVATRHRAIPEMIDDGVEGALVPLHDPRAIADAVVSLTGDPEVFARASAAARQRFERQFRQERHTRQMLQVLAPQ